MRHLLDPLGKGLGHFGSFLIFWYNDNIMSAQVGGFVDEKLYSRGGGDEGGDEAADDGQSTPTPQETDLYSLGRKLNAQRAEASRAAQIKSAATSAGKKMAENEVKTVIWTGLRSFVLWAGVAILPYILIIAGITFFLVIIIW